MVPFVLPSISWGCLLILCCAEEACVARYGRYSSLFMLYTNLEGFLVFYSSDCLFVAVQIWGSYTLAVVRIFCTVEVSLKCCKKISLVKFKPENVLTCEYGLYILPTPPPSPNHHQLHSLPYRWCEYRVVVASYPGPAQLFIACSTGRAWYLCSREMM